MDTEVWYDNFFHHIKSILVESRYTFKVSAGNIIRDRFLKKIYPPLRPPDLTTNNQALTVSVKVSSGPKAEEINNI